MISVRAPFDPVVFERAPDRSSVQRTRRIGFLIFPDFEIVRRAFKRNLNVGPHEYRERFQSTF